MRLKIYTAKTLSLAMERIRNELGDDAVIVNIDHGAKNGPVRVTAALEEQPAPIAVAVSEEVQVRSAELFDSKKLSAILRYHGLPTPLANRLQTSASTRSECDMAEALAHGLSDLIPSHPITTRSQRPLLLIGSPGHGKTLTAARLALDARMEDRVARVITLDAASAGALEQINGFCGPAEIIVDAASSAKHLEALLADPFEGFTVIDSQGINPYALPDIEMIAHVIKRSSAEPVWVLAAGTDALEAAEMAEIFASLGVHRMIVTRLDASRRLASILTAPVRSGLKIAGFSTSPFLADPLVAASPMVLAEYLLDKPDPSHIARFTQEKAAS